MRLVFILNLLIVVNSCDDFWKTWRTFPCAAADSCYRSENGSYVEIFNNTVAMMCNKEPIYEEFLKCSSIKNVQILRLTNCYLSEFSVKTFSSNQDVEEVFIKYNTHTNNFESVEFINMTSLKSVKFSGLRTSDSFRVVFDNVPSLVYLEITDYDFLSVRDKTFEKLANLSELRITNGMLKVLPSDIFHGLQNLTKLDLSFNKIETIDLSVFTSLTQLETIELNNLKISYLQANMLRGLSNLTKVYIFNNRISSIPSGYLKGLRKLTQFYAFSCNISLIYEDLFSDAINLTEVNFSENLIKTLPPKLFSNNKNLKVFRCFTNEISTLPEGLFEGLSKLELLGLGENRVEALSENIFSDLISLKSLYLSKNRITFIHENALLPLRNLEKIVISHNNFSEISGINPFGVSKNLKIIWAGQAGLKKLPKINWAQHNFRKVDFSGNHFETVELPIYTANPLKINLAYCNVQTIYIDESKYGFNMPSYELIKNKIACDNELQQFIYTVNSNLKVALHIFPDLKDMNCYGEEKKVLDKTFYFIKNHCPIDCDCYRENQDVIVNCSRRAMKTIPETVIEDATIVDLSHNMITEFSNVDCQSWNKVTGLILENNFVTNFSDEVLPPGITYLSLKDNHLTKLSDGLMAMIDRSADFRIFLSRNNLTCDCDSLFTKEWLLRNKAKILDFSDVSCRKKSLSSFMEIIFSEDCVYKK